MVDGNVHRSNVEIGRDGEAAAAEWYRRNGYRILDRNWRVRRGEIDLVVERGRVVVFCEVKTRRSTRYGRGFDAVDGRKQRQVRALALDWLDQHLGGFAQVRFDVADVNVDGTVEVAEGCF